MVELDDSKLKARRGPGSMVGGMVVLDVVDEGQRGCEISRPRAFSLGIRGGLRCRLQLPSTQLPQPPYPPPANVHCMQRLCD